MPDYAGWHEPIFAYPFSIFSSVDIRFFHHRRARYDRTVVPQTHIAFFVEFTYL